MTRLVARFTDDGLIIDGIFHEMPILKGEYSRLSSKLSSITPDGEIEIPSNDTLLKGCKYIRFNQVKVPETSQWLIRDLIGVENSSPNATANIFISELTRSLKNNSLKNNQDKIRSLKYRYLITIFKILKKHVDENFELLDLISFLSIFQFLEFVCVSPGILNIMEDNPDRFCKRCHRLQFSRHSDYCKECRRDIRNKDQIKRREIDKIRRLYCSGGCGKKLTGKQRVWCGDPECWLKIYLRLGSDEGDGKTPLFRAGM